MDEKFDEALAFMGRHPVMSGVGGFLGLYFAAGAFKSVSRMMGGGPKAAQFAKGGFDPKMNTKEALQILNLSENNLNRKKLKEVHRRIMLANHRTRAEALTWQLRSTKPRTFWRSAACANRWSARARSHNPHVHSNNTQIQKAWQ